jgi:IS30 family transposase
MTGPGQPRALDDDKQQTICAFVRAGASLRQAAHLVHCDPKTIRREAQRNDEFRGQLARAKSEANIHPLQTLRQAAKTNWRAALCWMERLDPQRFAKHNPKTITQREANQFAADLAESIERAVSDPNERKDLFELLAAAMPSAMRRRWDGKERRRVLADVINDLDVARRAALEQKAKRRRDLLVQIVSYLPWELTSQVAENADLFNLSDPPEGDTSPVATQPTTSAAPDQHLTPDT